MHFTKLSRLTALSICGLIAATTVQAQSGGSSLAKVNGVSIPQSRLEFIVKARTLQGQPDSPETRKTLREDLITEEVIAQEALKKRIGQGPGFRDPTGDGAPDRSR